MNESVNIGKYIENGITATFSTPVELKGPSAARRFDKWRAKSGVETPKVSQKIVGA